MAKKVIDISKLDKSLRELQALEAGLNKKINQAAFRKRLFKNPVETLKQEGLALPKNREKSITEFFQSTQIDKNADLRVASRPEPAGVFISIGIRF